MATERISETTPAALIRLMVGREIPAKADQERKYTAQPVSFSTRDLHFDPRGSRAQLDVRRGEIVGLAGLVGCGRTALLESIFGIRPHRGSIALNGKAVVISHPRDAIAAGIAYIPQDRKRDALVLSLSLENNLVLANFPAVSRLGLLNLRKKRLLSLNWISQLKVKCTGPLQPTRTLSGGNQQKVVLAKWLARNPVLLLLDEPTRGVDIGAKTEIHDIIRALATRGVAVLLGSSDMQELLQLSDRILVMRDGDIVDELSAAGVSEEEILRRAVPGVHAPME